MHAVILSSQYPRSLKRISRHKDFDHLKLESVIHIIECGQKLDPKYHDHELKGHLEGFREWHMQNDILLVYQIVEDKLVLILVDIGSHSDLF